MILLVSYSFVISASRFLFQSRHWIGDLEGDLDPLPLLAVGLLDLDLGVLDPDLVWDLPDLCEDLLRDLDLERDREGVRDILLDLDLDFDLEDAREPDLDLLLDFERDRDRDLSPSPC